MYDHILIAPDGSELARKGVEQGLALAAKLGSKVTIVSVTEPLDPRAAKAALDAGMEDPVGGYDRTVGEEMAARFADITQRAAAKGVVVELTHEIDEHPAEAIIRLADDIDCDLIVMSSHGRRGVRRLVLGSQTAEVVTGTTRPVLVIR
jgi:nucleotide-binding universal stress UspA family protein